MKALIDGDVLLYKCGFAAQHTWYEVYDEEYEDFGWIAKFPSAKACKEYMEGKEGLKRVSVIEVEPEENAINNIKTTLRAILRDTRCSSSIVYVSGSGNYREEIATISPYKGNRDPDHKPIHYNRCKEYLIGLPETVVVDGIEADDAMGMAQWEDWSRAHRYNAVMDTTIRYLTTVIVTNDKDLNMIPGYHYNYWGDKELKFISQLDADRFFYKQLLTGDATDNIPGLYKIAGKKALPKYLDPIDDIEDIRDMWKHVFNTYAKYVSTAKGEVFILLSEIARLLWISRTKPNDWEDSFG